MVTDDQLRSYAEKIYRNIEGYTFENIIKYFPQYYPSIRYYYDQLYQKDILIKIQYITQTAIAQVVNTTQIMIKDVADINRTNTTLKIELNRIQNIEDTKERALALNDYYAYAIKITQINQKILERQIKTYQNYYKTFEFYRGIPNIDYLLDEVIMRNIKYFAQTHDENEEWLEETERRGFEI